jgi:hypothetical protein
MKNIFLSLVVGIAFCLPAAQVPAAVFVYDAILSGPAEGNNSPGTGVAHLIIDSSAHTMHFETTFSGLTAGTTVAHVHCCTTTAFTGTASPATQVPTFVGFPTGVTAGSYENNFNLTLPESWNPAFVTASGNTLAGAEAAFLSGLNNGQAYFNIHTTAFTGGEIRGFFAPAVPEPSTWAMMFMGFAGIGFVAYRRSRRNEGRSLQPDL